MSAGEVISCRGVVKRFGSVTALDQLEFSVGAGRVVGYLGPNGAGKSTTIRILLDLARRDSGEVRVLGEDPRVAGAPLRARIGYLPGELRLDDRLTVEETLQSWSRLRGGLPDPRYVDELCDRLDLDRKRANRGLSSGNRRKVGLVGALMAKPELLILDEPTGGVDPLVQEVFLNLVEETRDEGRTVFLSSHVLSEVERIADEVIVIRSGRVVASGTIETLRQAVRQPFRVTFAADVEVPVDALRAVEGVRDVEVHGPIASGVIEGSPRPLLQLLGRSDIVHAVLAEPDLEQTFLQYYESAGAG